MICMHNIEWHKPKIYHGVKIAEKLGVDMSFACNARRRYLMQEIQLLELEIAFYRDYEGDLDSKYLSSLWWNELELKRLAALKELKSIKTITVKTDSITDEMIEAARNYPVDRLIEFKRGKAKCLEHQDNNPSMFYGTRTNQAVCPVCCKSWDSIGVLMVRDGMTFVEAVKQLSH